MAYGQRLRVIRAFELFHLQICKKVKNRSENTEAPATAEFCEQRSFKKRK